MRERRSSRMGRALAQFDGRLALGNVLFNFLRGLPEEEVGRDGGAQDADQRRPIVAGPLDTRNQGRPQDGGPVRVREKCRGDVGEQGEGEPFEDPGDEAIAGPEQQADEEQRVDGGPIEGADAGEQRGDVGHAAEIGGDVDDIGNDQQSASAP